MFDKCKVGGSNPPKPSGCSIHRFYILCNDKFDKIVNLKGHAVVSV